MAKEVNGFKAMKLGGEKIHDRRKRGWGQQVMEAFLDSGKESWGREYEDIEELISDRNCLASYIGRHRAECGPVRLIKRGMTLYLVNTELGGKEDGDD